jgi:hypothetical protein
MRSLLGLKRLGIDVRLESLYKFKKKKIINLSIIIFFFFLVIDTHKEGEVVAL